MERKHLQQTYKVDQGKADLVAADLKRLVDNGKAKVSGADDDPLGGLENDPELPSDDDDVTAVLYGKSTPGDA